jgi:nucleotide-binding universal stress UspA family protein
MTHLVAAVDFAEPTDAIVATAGRLAAALGASVTLIHVAEPDPAFVGYSGGPDVVREQVAAELHRKRRELETLAERLRSAGIEATPHVIQGAMVETIIEMALNRQAELIVMGSHGRGAVLEILVGSVSEGVIRRAPCPVVVIPARKRPA